MHKALQVELQDWQRDQEPDTDHEGFYQTSLPTIITQVDLVLIFCLWLGLQTVSGDRAQEIQWLSSQLGIKYQYVHVYLL